MSIKNKNKIQKISTSFHLIDCNTFSVKIIKRSIQIQISYIIISINFCIIYYTKSLKKKFILSNNIKNFIFL